MLLILVAYLPSIYFFFEPIRTIRSPHGVRNSPLEDYHGNHRLIVGLIESHKTWYLRTHCILLCIKKLECRSVNLCGVQMCELNFEDIFSTPKGANILEEEPTCDYIGMKKDHVPTCRENGKDIEMQEHIDSAGKCQIFGKGVNREWGKWELIDVDNETDWIKGTHRFI